MESYAGLTPPNSCLNDGLQISTGASLGRGTISIISGETLPAANFSHQGKKLRLQVKKEIAQRIQADIQKTIKQFGNLTPEYFAEIRRLSLTY